jgi:hypothetical protein
MDPIALERSIRNLENSLDSLEGWLALMTGLVVLGLVLEYWHEIPEAIEHLRKAWSWKPVCIIAGAILITIGVAGELVVQFIASGKETALRKGNDAVFAALNAKTGEAIERASKNEKEAAKAELRTKELEAEIQPRDLTIEQQVELKRKLGGFSGRVISLRSYSLDTEGKRLGKILKSVFESSGLTVSDNLGNLLNLGGNVVEGIQIAGPHSQDDLIDALLQSPLKTDEKIKMLRKDDPRLRPDALVEILVGVKPIVTLQSAGDESKH